MSTLTANDKLIADLISDGTISVDLTAGHAFSSRSNTPTKPLGSPTKKGYIRVALTVKGKCRALMVHRIIWIAANGIPPESTPQINHKDTCKSNNSIGNLELQTNAGNAQHAAMHGLLGKGRGEKARTAKLTAADVISLRKQYDEGMATTAIAAQFGITVVQARRIGKRQCWAWLA